MPPPIIRPATAEDLPAITAIYNHAILHTTATFDTEPKTEAEQLAWFKAHDERHPILVATTDAKLVGWASLSAWSDRCAYSDTAEVSTYVEAGYRSQGIGKRLMQAIDAAAQRLGFHTLIARISEGNAASMRMCETLGYVETGVMKEVGLKFGKRLDVSILQRFLGGPEPSVTEPSISAIVEICRRLSDGAIEEARVLAKRDLPFRTIRPEGRAYSVDQCMRVFMRDGCIDRYSGRRLVLPGALRLLSAILPEEFPYHPNWKTSACHPVYWHLSPTLDHIVPVARGGTKEAENLVTTSMLRNASKGLQTLEELGWTLLPPGDTDAWDGMRGWFVEYLGQHQQHLSNGMIRRWYRVASAGG